MNSRSQSRRKFEGDDCDGSQLGAKRTRVGEYPTAGNATFWSEDPVLAPAAAIFESEGYYSNSIDNADIGFDQHCAITDSRCFGEDYNESTSMETIAWTSNMIIDTSSTGGLLTDTALTYDTYVDTMYTKTTETDATSVDNMFVDTVFADKIVSDTISIDNMCIDAELATERPLNICYGALCDAKVKLSKGFMASISTTGVWDQYQELGVFQQNGVYHLRGNTSQESIGVLDIASNRILRSLHGLSDLTYMAILETSSLKELARSKTQSGKMDASINILGPESLFDRVGDAITDEQGHLQHPFFLPKGTGYINPHWFYSQNVPTDLRYLIGPRSSSSKDVRLTSGLVDIFRGLGCSQDSYVAFENLVDLSDVNQSLVTLLKSHQVEGVKHILARENYERVASAAHVLQSVIGHTVFKERLMPLHGGIDADVMGLGKTLTMLSAIVCTLRGATDFVDSSNEVEKPLKSRATLVVVSSHQLVEVWRSEAGKHFKKDTLRVGVFHGSNRAKVESDIVNHDIVLTTYQTLVADQKSIGLLQRVEWFRVVLDEAHWIRNSTSQQFKAACNLRAARRWCLSGTPISNSLDDLRSLLAFLQFRPFSEPGFFRKHIVDPIGTDSPDQFRNLRALLHAICFRRTADLLSLPPHLTEEVTITLSSRETEMYEHIVAQSRREYEEIANMRSSKKRYAVLFATTIKLRRLCNHGTFQEPPSPNLNTLKPGTRGKSRTIKGLDAENEPLCEYCCGDNADLDYAWDTLTVCPECSRNLEHQLGVASMKGRQSPATESARVTPSSQRGVGECLASPSRELMGWSSKLNTVVDNIQKTPASSKNLVFTSWRMTLNILQRLLIERGIPSLRIDGQTSYTDRQVILRQFCEDPKEIVLLLSIQTGAVGLTLTVADRVHIVEPQWNPLVEEQACGRALRIGQTRSATIFKYVTKRTVEENIVSLQKRKNHLARISLDKCSGDHAEERLEDFMFVLQ